jgi:hypothetical protein
MIRRTLTFSAALLVATSIWAGATAPAGAASPNDEMRASLLALRGLIDRAGAERCFTYPRQTAVHPGRLAGSALWPDDPWTGADLRPGMSRGRYRYIVTPDRRRYRLVGYLDGGTMVLSGGMPRSIVRAYDHRSEEGINLIRQYIEAYAAANDGVYPLPAEVESGGAVGQEPRRRYWPSNPWDHRDMTQRNDRGSFAYSVAADGSSYELRLHRALKRDYVLTEGILASPWRQLLPGLQDEILRRSGRILRGYIDQWSSQHGGVPPAVAEMAPSAAVATAHPGWPLDPVGGGAMAPGTAPGSFTYAPGAAGAYTLTIHLHSADHQAGGIAPSPTAPARSSTGAPE